MHKGMHALDGQARHALHAAAWLPELAEPNHAAGVQLGVNPPAAPGEWLPIEDELLALGVRRFGVGPRHLPS